MAALNIEALVLIEGDLEAQRLVVTWPQVGAAYEAAQADPGPPVHTDTTGPVVEPLEEVRHRWASISGVYEGDLLRLEPILFANGILGPAGSVENVVLAFIRSRIAKGLPKQQGANRGRV